MGRPRQWRRSGTSRCSPSSSGHSKPTGHRASRGVRGSSLTVTAAPANHEPPRACLAPLSAVPSCAPAPCIRRAIPVLGQTLQEGEAVSEAGRRGDDSNHAVQQIDPQNGNSELFFQVHFPGGEFPSVGTLVAAAEEVRRAACLRLGLCPHHGRVLEALPPESRRRQETRLRRPIHPQVGLLPRRLVCDVQVWTLQRYAGETRTLSPVGTARSPPAANGTTSNSSRDTSSGTVSPG
jgi:hypothetical protein